MSEPRAQAAAVGETLDDHALHEAYESTLLTPGSGPRSGLSAAAEGVTPMALADWMLALLALGKANLVSVCPDPRAGAVLEVKRGGATPFACRLSPDHAAATVTRLALLASLDPLEEHGSLASLANVARVRVRTGEHVAEVLVSVGATADGLDAEVRALGASDSAPPSRGVSLRRCPRCGEWSAPSLAVCARDDTPLVDVPDDPRPGGNIGVYRLLGHIGAGGMGVVLSGEHVFLGRPVAIKVMRRAVADSSMMVRRFLAEARAASRINHPHVVEVTDYGVLADGRPYLVMDHVSGQPLDEMLRARGPLDPAEALRLARAVAEGLAAAHERGVVHNDLKPANIVLTEGSTDEHPALKIVDFGAASLQSGAASLSMDERIGTPAYMSPEQVRGEPTDARSDVYALGAVLYEMLTGAPPFTGDVPGVLRAHLTLEPGPVSAPAGPLPRAVSRVVLRALSKSVEQRPQSAAELVRDIDRALAVLGRPNWRKWLPA